MKLVESPILTNVNSSVSESFGEEFETSGEEITENSVLSQSEPAEEKQVSNFSETENFDKKVDSSDEIAANSEKSEENAENAKQVSNFTESSGIFEKLGNYEKESKKFDQVSNFSEAVSHSDSDYRGPYEVMITTFDNPFDPFENFDQWFLFDEEKGYHTCAYLGRLAEVSDDMSEEEEMGEIERAVDQIIRYDFTNKYKKLKRPAEGPDSVEEEGPPGGS